MTVGDLKAAVAPALRGILTTEELASASVRVLAADAPLASLADDTRLGPEMQLQVLVLGESLVVWVDERESAQQAYERVRSDLQDFVAESAFGWGQLRP